MYDSIFIHLSPYVTNAHAASHSKSTQIRNEFHLPASSDRNTSKRATPKVILCPQETHYVHTCRFQSLRVEVKTDTPKRKRESNLRLDTSEA
jgi:hypothetical protein